MRELGICPVQPEDLPALKRLWQESFGDSEALIDGFFRRLPEMGAGLAAKAGERTVGMAYLIDGLSVDGKKCGYLYAVAVDPAFRGQGAGAALSRAVFALGRERGAEILCTQPAEPGLFAWYHEILGVDCALRRRTERFAAAPGRTRPLPLSPEEYHLAREEQLAGVRHLSLSEAALGFEWELCRSCGGGFYRLGDTVAAAYLDGEALIVPELLGDRDSACALAAALGAKEAQVRFPDPEGDAYLAAMPGTLPADCCWNLSFD